MEKLFDAVLKHLPIPIIFGVLAAVVAFLGVHYWRGFRDYGDTLRDRTFLSFSIALVALLLIYLVNKQPTAPASGPPLILVPFFENDDRDQVRTAFASQLDQALSRAGYSRAVYSIEGSFSEYESAIKSARRLGAQAAIFQAMVIRDKDLTRVCFQIALVSSDSSKPFAMLPVELPAKTLDEIASSVLALAEIATNQFQRSPVFSRIDTLEKQLQEVRAAFDQLVGSQRAVETHQNYRRKHAVLVGVNDVADVGFSLQYAVSDAKSFSEVLKNYGFDTTLLLNKFATRASVLDAIAGLRNQATDEDLVVFYYAGNASVESLPGRRDRSLFLLLADSRLDNIRSSISISELTKALEGTPGRHKIAILDSCYGTTGLTEVASSVMSPIATKADSPIFQYFVASGDDEIAEESSSLGGGAFTQSIIKVLSEGLLTGGNNGLWMREVVIRTGTRIREHSMGRQSPKLVTVSGEGEVYWSPVR